MHHILVNIAEHICNGNIMLRINITTHVIVFKQLPLCNFLNWKFYYVSYHIKTLHCVACCFRFGLGEILNWERKRIFILFVKVYTIKLSYSGQHRLWGGIIVWCLWVHITIIFLLHRQCDYMFHCLRDLGLESICGIFFLLGYC